jgi:hypothetical protein
MSDDELVFPDPVRRTVGRLMKWQPIETAPKVDGVRVLLGWVETIFPVSTGFYYAAIDRWCDDATENDYCPQPTHWMPLPTPPSAHKERT